MLQKEHHRYMSRHVISVSEAIALIFDEALEGDPGELSDEDQLCSAAEFEEQESEVDDDGPPSPKQRQLAAESSDSLPPDFFTPIRQNTQPDPVVLDSSDISTAFEVSIGTEPEPEVSDILCHTTSNSSVGYMSSLFVFGNLPVDQLRTVQLLPCNLVFPSVMTLFWLTQKRLYNCKVRAHECSGNFLQQFSNDEVLAAIWGICELSVEKNMLLLGKLMTWSMNSMSRKGKEKKRMGHYFAFDHRRVCCNLLYSS